MRARCRSCSARCWPRLQTTSWSGWGRARFLLCGIFALAAATTLLAFAQTPWQLYAAYILLACGWMGMGTVVIATIVSSWFDRPRARHQHRVQRCDLRRHHHRSDARRPYRRHRLHRGDADNDRCDDFRSGPCRDRIDRCCPGTPAIRSGQAGCAGIIAQGAADEISILDHYGAVRPRIAGAGRLHRASDRTAGAGSGRAGRARRRGDDGDGRDRTALPRTGRRPA